MPSNYKGKSIPIAHILEVNQQTCEAKISQVSYKVRLWLDLDGKKGSACTSVLQMCEMELGKNVETS